MWLLPHHEKTTMSTLFINQLRTTWRALRYSPLVSKSSTASSSRGRRRLCPRHCGGIPTAYAGRDSLSTRSRNLIRTRQRLCITLASTGSATSATAAIRSEDDFHDGGTVYLFLREFLLHWLEALSLLRSVIARRSFNNEAQELNYG